MAENSETPLAQKLGLRPGTRCLIGGTVPEGLSNWWAPLPEGIRLGRWPEDHVGGPADVLLYFTRTRSALAQDLVGLLAGMTPVGALWVSWPKKSSRLAGDLTEDGVRQVALPLGVVDNKVCAISADWSGLRLVWRKENRPR